MSRSEELPRLTQPELEVMKRLWSGGRMSARELHEQVGEAQGWAYSTTRTTLERMVGKGLVSKGSFHGLHLYGARISRATGLARMVWEFATQVVGTGPSPVVSLFAESGALEDQEIDELRALLEERSAASDDRSSRSGEGS